MVEVAGELQALRLAPGQRPHGLAELLVDTLEEPIRYTEGKSIGIKR